MGETVGGVSGPAKTLGPTLLAFVGEVLFNDLSSATTVAEAAELARGFQGCVDSLAALETRGVSVRTATDGLSFYESVGRRAGFYGGASVAEGSRGWRVWPNPIGDRLLEGVGQSGIGAVAHDRDWETHP